MKKIDTLVLEGSDEDIAAGLDMAYSHIEYEQTFRPNLKFSLDETKNEEDK